MSSRPLPALSASLARHLESLPVERKRALGERLTRRARSLGLEVVRDARPVDIATTLTPDLVSRSVAETRGRDAAAVLEGVVLTARRVLGEPAEQALAEQLFGHFGPLEKAGLARWREAEDVTIARVDWFVDADGRHRALELNATIPAMQAYSDAAAIAWLETLGAEAGLTSERIRHLAERNGSNADALRRSIVAHGESTRPHPSIAIVHRKGDPQIKELEALQRRFIEAGHDTWLGIDAEVALEEGQVTVGGRRPDLLFRHIFARRIVAGSALDAIARGAGQPRMQNPVNGHLEVKGLLAELSRRVDDHDSASLGLSDETLEVLARVLPWTRLLAPGVTRGPDGSSADLVAMVEATPEAFVLKRSWDYGGKSVLIGRDVLASEGRESWVTRVKQAVADTPGSWVVQQHIDSPRRRHLVLGEADPQWEEVYVDASTFTASGTRDVPGGGVSRFARSGVVNIAGGGGVAPLILDDVAEEIARALEGQLAE